MDDLLVFSFLLEKITRKEIGHNSLRFQFLLKFFPDGMSAIDSLQTSPAAPANSLSSAFQDRFAGETNRRVNKIAKRDEDVPEKSVCPVPDMILRHVR